MQPLPPTDPPITPERLAALLLWLAEQGEAGLGAREVAEVLWLTRLLPAPAGVDKPEEPIDPDPTPQPQPSHPGAEPERQQDVASREDTSKGRPREEPNAAAAALLPAEALPSMDDLPQVVPVWLEDPPLLSQPLLYQKALAPLLAQRAESGRVRVDEEETVERYGRDLAARFRGTWSPITPVWRPVPEPRFDLVLAMDGGLSMRLWERLLPELRRVFAAAGAFRDLKILPLFDGQGRLRPIAQLIPPPQEGRQLLLLLSDCAGEHWWSGALRPVLEHWAIHLPYAVLQVLPRRMWERTALGQEAFSMSNSVPAAPARRYRIGPQRRIPRRRRGPELDAGALLLPVLSCDPDSLRSWSGVVMGDPRLRIAGYRLPQPQPSRNSQEAPAAEVEPLQQWQRYCELASPQGRELARLLSAAPVLTLPVMRLVKQALMAGDPTPLAMAEVLLGGLLRLIPGQPDPRQPDRCDALQFDFRPGLREHLLAQSDRADTLAVMKAVSLLVQERWNRFAPDQSFQAYLLDPRAQAPANLQGLQAFGKVMATIVERLGGRYQTFAQELRQGAQKVAASSGKGETASVRVRVGGSLPPSYGGYVERTADREVDALLREGRSCCVFSSRQMGKSSLRVRMVERLRADGVVCAVIDPTTGVTRLTEEQWYAGTISMLIDDLGLKEQVALGSWWQSSDVQTLPPVSRFEAFIDQILLEKIKAPIVIFVEDVDSLLSLPFDTDSFFILLLSFQQQRDGKPDTRRLTFCLLGVASPTGLIRNSAAPSFEIGPVVELACFTRQEATPLLAGLRGRVAEPEAALDAVLHWSGGQPFLTLKLLDLLVRAPQGDQATASWVEQVVREKVIEDWEAQDTPRHLGIIRDRLRSPVAGEGLSRWLLVQLYQEVLRQPDGVPMEPTSTHRDLLLTGLVTLVKGRLLLANPIYGDVFNGPWVDQLRMVMEAETKAALDQSRAWGKRFRVALAFSSKIRDYIWQTAQRLADEFGRERILYDQFHEAELARPDLARYLPKLFAQADLVVIVACKDDDTQHWFGPERRMLQSLVEKNLTPEILLARFDRVEPEAFSPTARFFLDLDDKTPKQFVDFILQRLALLEGKPVDDAPSNRAPQADQPANLYLSYVSKDKRLCEQLSKTLAPLQREGLLNFWSGNELDVEGLPAEYWSDAINNSLASADIILCLLSEHYLVSKWCNAELSRAMERFAAGEAMVIPVILRPCDWSRSPLGKLQALPAGGKPITLWRQRDQALLSMVQSLRVVVASQTWRHKREATTSQAEERESSQTSGPSQPELPPFGAFGAPPSPLPKLERPEGAVPLGSPFYVASSFEPRLKTELTKPGAMIRIEGPRGYGKSSLVLRLIAFANKKGYRAVAIDLQRTDPKLFADPELFLKWFCAALGQELGIVAPVEEVWDDIFSPNDNSSDYFEKHVLKHDAAPLLLAIDNFDRLFAHPAIAADFCGLLRNWHERALINPLWESLRLVLAHARELPEGEIDIHNDGLLLPIGYRAWLDQDLPPDQVRMLVLLHGLRLSEVELGELLELVGGHPYLVRKALYALATGLSFASFLREAPTEEGVYGDHLRGMFQAVADHPELEETLGRVVNSTEPVWVSTSDAFKFEGLGVLWPEGPLERPRYPLYANYFRNRLGR